jgi:LPXTG-site transpeptidase (sortase) family protein
MITIARIIPIGFLFVGVFLLMQVILPLASFKLWEIGQKYNNTLLISPSNSPDNQVLGISINNQDNFSSFVSSIKRESQPNYTEFSLTIPKLKINDEKVQVDSNDLSNGLAHLPGAALPGEKGNVFISGHSALSRMFNLKKAVFENLTDLKKGDEIIVDVLGVKYKYQVEELKVVSPNDLSVINPPQEQGRYISLMTCVPPGLNFKRLVVLGKMI